MSSEPGLDPMDELDAIEDIKDPGRLERLLSAQPVARLIPRVYRSRRLRAAVFGLDPASDLRQTLVSQYAAWVYEQYNETGEIPWLAFADDVELYQAAELLGTTGLFRGHEGLEAALAELRESFDDVRFKPERTITIGHDRALVLVRFSAVGRGSGVAVDAPLGHVFVVNDGNIARWEIHWERADALASLGMPADFLG